MITRLDDADVHATPNATMARYPGCDVAVWRTEMDPHATGPCHRIDVDQMVVLVHGDPDTPGIPLLEGRPLVGGNPAAYVCRGFVCDRPVTTTEELSQALATRSAP